MFIFQEDDIPVKKLKYTDREVIILLQTCKKGKESVDLVAVSVCYSISLVAPVQHYNSRLYTSCMFIIVYNGVTLLSNYYCLLITANAQFLC